MDYVTVNLTKKVSKKTIRRKLLAYQKTWTARSIVDAKDLIDTVCFLQILGLTAVMNKIATDLAQRATDALKVIGNEKGMADAIKVLEQAKNNALEGHCPSAAHLLSHGKADAVIAATERLLPGFWEITSHTETWNGAKRDEDLIIAGLICDILKEEDLL